MTRPQDVGGREAGPIPLGASDELEEWESLADGILSALMFRAKLVQDGELRRTIELLPHAEYAAAEYYERWAWGIELLCIEKGCFTRDDLDRTEGAIASAPSRLEPGTRVRVRRAVRARHDRTPGYVQGRTGTVTRYMGRFADNESHAYGAAGLPTRGLYDVRFHARDLWPDAPREDTVDVALYRQWLVPDGVAEEPPAGSRLRAIRALLIEKGVLTAEDIDALAHNLLRRTLADGARVVARAWSDPAFRARLLEDADAAIVDSGITGVVRFTNLHAVENTDDAHHLVVGTLDSSGWPRQLAGPPPRWFKSLEYRARAVRDPRGVLREMGTELPARMAVRVIDCVSHLRILVIPRRPPGTESLSEEDLAALVTPESLVGAGEARVPAAVRA